MFYFHVYGKMAEENIMYQELQKICREKVCRIKSFSGKFEEISSKISFARPRIACFYT